MSSSTTISAIADFCKELREAREFQQVNLNEVARRTRVSVEFLQALEAGRWEQIPRAYLRGYLGLYADALGMNREKVLRSFDLLATPSSARRGAVLNDSTPLLEAPEDMGVTRAKIRATWFAALSRNRRTLYTSTFLVVVALFVVLNITRRVRNPQVPERPFSEALLESRERVYSPLLIVPVNSEPGSTRQSGSAANWIDIIGDGAGTLGLTRDQDTLQRYRFSIMDTIKIQYINEVVFWVTPAASASAMVDTSRLLPIHRSPADTAFYEIRTDKPALLDTSRTMIDSL